MFTFVKHPNMQLANNFSERTLRRIVLYKKIRLLFQSLVGMMTYGIIPMTYMMTWNAQGYYMIQKIHQAIRPYSQ